MSEKRQEIERRVAELQDQLAGVPGRVVVLETEAEELRSAMSEDVLQGDLEEPRERLRAIDLAVEDLEQDGLLYEKAIAKAEAELAEFKKQSWATREGLYLKQLRQLESDFRLSVVGVYRVANEIFNLLESMQNTAHELGVDEQALGWRNWRNLGGGYITLLLTRLGRAKMNLDVSPGQTARGWMEEDLAEELEKA